MNPLEKLKHDFVPNEKDKYCNHWNGSERSTGEGTLAFSSQCGYPAVAHQDQPGEWR